MTPAAAFLALELVTAVRVRDPLPGGGDAVARTTGWSLVERRGDDLVVRACAVTTTPVLGTTTRYSPAFVAAAPVDTTTSTVDGDRFAAGPWTSVFGATDADSDGHPGLTVQVESSLLGRGDVYVTQTSTTRLVGVVSPDGSISGRATVDTVQELHGATAWWLRIPTSPRPDPDASRFRLVPVAEGTCAAVAAALARPPVGTE